MIVGLAGHVDHGKTALVKVLTGIAGDRLKDEKARGITIDLGFAYMPTRSGQPIGFIDVPGHERFVHTMLAGASGVDFALLTIAVDDGIMPQTLEHLAILDLLGVDRGAVVITKADLASPEAIENVARQAKAMIAATTLAQAEVLTVSALTGAGVDALRAHLEEASGAVRDRAAGKRFRLAVDRVFTLSGVGVVATGTVLSGSVHLGDRIQLSPSGLLARVRSLHAQNRPAEAAHAGERCALNLTGSGITKDAVRRGDVALDPELHAPTDRIDARIRVLPTEKKPIGQWFPVRLHHAATEAGARIVLFDDEPIAPGEAANVQLVLDRPIAAASHDRFVVRDVSAQRTLGGGLFLDLRAKARGRRTLERREQRAALALADPSASIAALLETPPFAFDLAAFAQDRALSAEAEGSPRVGAWACHFGSGRFKNRVDPRALGPLRVDHTRADRRLSRRKSGSSRVRTRTAAGHVAAKTSEAGIRRRLEKACRLKPSRSGRRVRQTSVARGAACARGPSRVGDDRAASWRGATVPSAKSARPRSGDRSRGKRSAPRPQTRRPPGLG